MKHSLLQLINQRKHYYYHKNYFLLLTVCFFMCTHGMKDSFISKVVINSEQYSASCDKKDQIFLKNKKSFGPLFFDHYKHELIDLIKKKECLNIDIIYELNKNNETFDNLLKLPTNVPVISDIANQVNVDTNKDISTSEKTSVDLNKKSYKNWKYFFDLANKKDGFDQDLFIQSFTNHIQDGGTIAPLFSYNPFNKAMDHELSTSTMRSMIDAKADVNQVEFKAQFSFMQQFITEEAKRNVNNSDLSYYNTLPAYKLKNEFDDSRLIIRDNRNEFFESPLLKAIKNKDEALVDFFINNSADCNISFVTFKKWMNERGDFIQPFFEIMSCLRYACIKIEKDNKRIISLLFNKGNASPLYKNGSFFYKAHKEGRGFSMGSDKSYVAYLSKYSNWKDDEKITFFDYHFDKYDFKAEDFINKLFDSNTSFEHGSMIVTYFSEKKPNEFFNALIEERVLKPILLSLLIFRSTNRKAKCLPRPIQLKIIKFLIDTKDYSIRDAVNKLEKSGEKEELDESTFNRIQDLNESKNNNNYFSYFKEGFFLLYDINERIIRREFEN